MSQLLREFHKKEEKELHRNSWISAPLGRKRVFRQERLWLCNWIHFRRKWERRMNLILQLGGEACNAEVADVVGQPCSNEAKRKEESPEPVGLGVNSPSSAGPTSGQSSVSIVGSFSTTFFIKSFLVFKCSFFSSTRKRNFTLCTRSRHAHATPMPASQSLLLARVV